MIISRRTTYMAGLSLLMVACGNADDGGAVAADGHEMKSGAIARAFPDRIGETRTEVLALPGLEVQPITYELIDGNAVFQGDIVFDLERARSLAAQLTKEDAADGIASRSAGRANELSRWLGGTVPYMINGNPSGAHSVVDQAIAHWQATTPIRFVRRTTEGNFVNFVTTQTNGCYSTSIGRDTNGGTTIGLQQPGCGLAAAIHEIGHAVGLYHEQSRTDRDNNVNVNWSNIKSAMQSQFHTYVQQGRDGFDNRTFDFASTMLYPAIIGDPNFVNNTSVPAMTRKIPGCTATSTSAACLWNTPTFLSAGDVQAVGRMYPRFSTFATSGMPTIHSNFSPAITTWGPGRLDVLAINDAGNLVHQYFSGGWSGWVDNFGGFATSGVDAVSWGVNRLDAVARGGDGACWHFALDFTVPGSPVTSWESLGGGIVGSPAIVSGGPGQLDVFARGTDNQLYHRQYRAGAGGWNASWIPRGGILTAGIDGVANGARIDLVSRNSANKMVHKTFLNSWTDWTDRGGFLQNDPTIASWQNGHWDIFGQAGDNTIWKRSHQIEWEANWGPVGGGFGSDPDVVSWGIGRLDMVVRDAAGNLRHGSVQN